MQYKILFLLPALAAAGPIAARQSPPSEQITIVSAATSGNGCPQGSVSTSISPDRTVITFGFDSFQTYIGPGAARSDATKNCQIHLNLKYPSGFTYSVLDATYHGYARLDPGVTGNFLSTYFFSQAASQTANTRSSVEGPQWVKGDVYTKHDEVESTATVWAPCGSTGLLNVNNRIALTSSNSSAKGELSNDDATVAFTQQVHVAWKKCTPGGSTGGGTFTPGGGSTEFLPREAAPEPEPQDEWHIGPGKTIIIPGNPTAIRPRPGRPNRPHAPAYPDSPEVPDRDNDPAWDFPGAPDRSIGGDDNGSLPPIVIGNIQ